MKKYILSILFAGTMFLISNAQDLNFGLRAGLNYSQFTGPSVMGADESYSLNGGFHFGFNVRYNVSDFVSFQSEILYTQAGTKYNYEGDGWHVYPTDDNNRLVVRDISIIDIKISNAYISIPLTAHIKTLEKWEFYGGAYVSFLASPIGTGEKEFGTIGEDYAFIQSLSYNYNKDEVGEFNTLGGVVRLIVNEEDVDIPSVVGAYYLYEEKEDDLFNGIDYGLAAGINYYMNRGLYLGLRMDYGLSDLTDNKVDASNQSINDDGSFIFSEDIDKHLGFQLSVGFKF